jgi:hypothetical protein
LLLTTQGWPPDSCLTTAAMVTGSTAGAHIIKSSSTVPRHPNLEPMMNAATVENAPNPTAANT